MENSKIEWTDHTFNPWIGCTRVSPGCDHCYAEALSRARLGVEWGPGAPRRKTKPANWAKVRGWDRKAAAAGVRAKVFCSSLADVFDNEVSAEWRAELATLIMETPNLDWLLLTKRIGNAAVMLEAMFAPSQAPRNVWLGATIVNQVEADRDIPKLVATPAARRFLSMEPLLQPVRLKPEWMVPEAINWVIVGGESGPGARTMHPAWVRSLRDQCHAAGVPFLFKQWGEHIAIPAPDAKWKDGTPVHPSFEPVTYSRVGKKAAGRLLDGVEHNGAPA